MNPQIIEKTVPVSEIFQETPDTKTLRFSLDKPMAFIPGQFVMLSVNIPDKEKPEKRAFSFSSSPLRQDYFDLTIKKEFKGLVSGFLVDTIKEGDRFFIKGPYGKFKLDNDDMKEVVLIGAGSGIAPLRSMLQYILDKKLDTKVTLFFSVKKPEDIIFKEELEQLHKDHDNFTYVLAVTQVEHEHGHSGRINIDLIKMHTINPEAYFICGPTPMVNSIRQQLYDDGVPKENVKTEKW